MRDMGVHGVLVYCQDYKCSHSLCSAPIGGLTMLGGISVFTATVDQHDESQGRAVPADAHISP
jgi:hypothetical protein